MNPFAIQRRAFEWMQAGDFRAAGEQFARAMVGFDRLLADPQARAFAVERARLIPDHEADAEEIAEQFWRALPEWLREMHFDGFCEALRKHAIEAARMHWRALVKAAGLPAMAGSVKLDLLRDRVCLQFKVTSEALSDSASGAQETLQLAERILGADKDNKTARRIAISGYTSELQTAMDGLPAVRKKTDPALALNHLKLGERRRLEVRLRKAVRRLRSHLRMGRGRTDSDTEQMVFSHQQLCHYYIGVGEIEMAIRLARRARRLRPGDEKLRRWARRVRQMRKRG